MKKSLLIAGLMAAGMSNVYADDSNWSGTGTLGFSTTTGNTDTTTIVAGLAGKFENDNWITTASLDVLRADSNGVDTADRYILAVKDGYKFSETDYVFFSTRYENDNFTAFDYTWTNAVGWGHKFMDTEDNRLITELGVGYKIAAFDIDRSEQNGTVFTGKLDFMHKFNDTMSFEDVLLVEATSDNTFIQNDAGLSFKVSDKAAIKLAHQWRHNTDAPVGTHSTDTLFSANLVYGF